MAHAYRIHSQVSSDGTLTIENLPFRPGEDVEVIVLAEERRAEGESRYPLRGSVLKYDNPMDPVAESDWDALQ
jgi:hypothetical protein